MKSAATKCLAMTLSLTSLATYASVSDWEDIPVSDRTLSLTRGLDNASFVDGVNTCHITNIAKDGVTWFQCNEKNQSGAYIHEKKDCTKCSVLGQSLNVKSGTPAPGHRGYRTHDSIGCGDKEEGVCLKGVCTSAILLEGGYTKPLIFYEEQALDP